MGWQWCPWLSGRLPHQSRAVLRSMQVRVRMLLIARVRPCSILLVVEKVGDERNVSDGMSDTMKLLLTSVVSATPNANNILHPEWAHTCMAGTSMSTHGCSARTNRKHRGCGDRIAIQINLWQCPTLDQGNLTTSGLSSRADDVLLPAFRWNSLRQHHANVGNHANSSSSSFRPASCWAARAGAVAAQITGPVQVARRSDVDMNQHLNNVTYLAWCLETVPLDIYTDCQLYQVPAPRPPHHHRPRRRRDHHGCCGSRCIGVLVRAPRISQQLRDACFISARGVHGNCLFFQHARAAKTAFQARALA